MTHEPLIPLAIPNIGSLEGEYLQACVRENFVSTVGRFVTEFEAGIAARSGVESAAALGSGTQALHLALVALDIRPGDLVILPSFTFIASANAISHCGASPWLMDIAPDNWTLDPQRVAAALASQTERRGGELIHKASGRRVSAIMPVYTLGTVADMDAFREIARQYGLRLIADAAAAIGATYKDRPIGLLADLTAYSFNGNKTITSGGGGAVTGPDSALVKRVKHLSSTARISPDYDHDEVGYNYRMTNIEAAVGCAQLQRLDEFLEAKRRIRAGYDAAFADVAGVSAFPVPARGESTYWFSGIVLEDDRLPSVAKLCFGLRERGVEARPFWKPVHLQTPYLGAPREDMPVTDGLWSRIITLPCSTSLTAQEQAKVIDTLKSLLTTEQRMGECA
ncbi:aminotransferase class I/II-fold pyridoxal phosphate-dependent enzyme [Brucella sp. IR073]|uniref:aminotransferase class I/II-fold pyridoxal phosphate-dependent enzyme n=1 Tax=unclassified Brucella TaxID=2632610 RepID=UPI003B982CA6